MLSSAVAVLLVAGSLVAQASGNSPSVDPAPPGRVSLPGSSAAGALVAPAASLPPGGTLLPAPVFGWSTTESRPAAVRRALLLSDSGWPDSAAAALRRAMAGLSGRERARALFDLGLVETTTAASVSRLRAASDSSPELRAAAWLSAGEALLVAGYPESARGWFMASRGLKQGMASERAAFLVGAAWLQSSQWPQARIAFSDYLVEYLSGSWQPAARLGIALANEQMGRRREAVEIYRAILNQHRGFDDEPWLMAHLADLLDTDAADEATRLRARLRDEYAGWRPEDSVEAAPAAPAAPAARPDSSPRTATPAARTPVPAARTPVSTPAATPASPPRVETWSLQVGAFRDRDRAEQQRRRFTVRGWTAEVVLRAPWHTVFAGRYASRARAEAMMGEASRIAGQDVRAVRR